MIKQSFMICPVVFMVVALLNSITGQTYDHSTAWENGPEHAFSSDLQ
jgi:hypothetical protein